MLAAATGNERPSKSECAEPSEQMMKTAGGGGGGGERLSQILVADPLSNSLVQYRAYAGTSEQHF